MLLFDMYDYEVMRLTALKSISCRNELMIDQRLGL